MHISLSCKNFIQGSAEEKLTTIHHLVSSICLSRMLHRRIISFLTLKNKPQKSQPANDLDPRLPLELIYKLIDDHISPSNELRTVRALALTCRALVAYCRPLLFRTIHLEYHRPPCFGPRLSTSDFPCQGKPDRFLRVILRSPDVLDEIQRLSFHFDPESAARKDDTARQQWKVLTDVLSLPYPNVRYLKIGGEWRYYTPTSVKQAIVSLLLRSHGLQSLELGLFGQIPFHLLACIPPTVKHLTENAIHPSVPISDVMLDPSLPPVSLSIHSIKLETLTLARAGGAPILHTLLSPQSPISLASLKHLQIGECFTEQVFDATCARVVSLCSSTLQCLHIGISSYRRRTDDFHGIIADVPIPLGELRSLKVLEIRTDATALEATLRWLSESIATIPLEEERNEFMQRLKISILFSHTLCCGCLPCLKGTKFSKLQPPNRKTGVPPSWYLKTLSTKIGENLQYDPSIRELVPSLKAMSSTAWHEKLWERRMAVGQEIQSWPNLGLARFSLFLEHHDRDRQCPLITEEPPVAFEHGDSYTSLWDGCPCSGWRYQT